MESIKNGDLVTLKGFQDRLEDVPIGVVISTKHRTYYKVLWANKELQRRWAISDLINKKKLEKLNIESSG